MMEQQDNHNTQQKNEVALKTHTNTTITKQTPPQIEVIDINSIIAHAKTRKNHHRIITNKMNPYGKNPPLCT